MEGWFVGCASAESKNNPKGHHRSTRKNYAIKIVPGGALLEETTAAQQNADGANKLLWIDGYPMNLNKKTKFFAYQAPAFFNIRLKQIDMVQVHAYSHKSHSNISFSDKLLKPGTWITYQAFLKSNRTITATQLGLWPDFVGIDEKKFLRLFASEIEAPNYEKHIAGSIQYKHGDAIKILPEQHVQEYISQLGTELLPQYQKQLAADDPTKIDFRFYVVYPFTDTPGNHFVEIDGAPPKFGFFARSHITYNSPQRNTRVQDVISMPNGVIIIPDITLVRMHSRAQLAALLSYAVTSVVQRQAYIAWRNVTSPRARRFNIHPSYIYAFSYWQNEQALRIGIRQMYLAGYDIREAPFAWAVAQGKPVQNPIINSKHPDQEIPWYAAYAFNYISHYYQDVDYSKLKRGEREYQHFLQELYKADPSLPRPQTQLKPQASTRPQAAAQPAPQSSPAAPTASASPAASPVAPSSATPATTQAH